jgi:hypothetical protein
MLLMIDNYDHVPIRAMDVYLFWKSVLYHGVIF